MSKKRLRKAEKKEDTSRKARVRAAGGNSAPADALRPLRTFGDARHRQTLVGILMQELASGIQDALPTLPLAPGP